MIGSKIGAEGAKWISEALKVNKSITDIDIGGMKFDIDMNKREITNVFD